MSFFYSIGDTSTITQNFATSALATYNVSALPPNETIFGHEYDVISSESQSDPSSTIAELTEAFVYTKMIPFVCAFGIAGNILNLVVLSRKSLIYSMARMEKSAHCSLMALAVSDLLFCIVVLPSSFYGINRSAGGSFIHASFDFRLAYKLYGNGVVNTFVLTSTWLTVTMAVGRYLAVCHPLHARQFIGKRFSVASLVSVFVICQLFNIPRMFVNELRTITRSDVDVTNSSLSSSTSQAKVFYFVYPGPVRRNRDVERAYEWTYFAFGIVVPLIVLIYCNAHLSAALRRSLRLRYESGGGGGSNFGSATGTGSLVSFRRSIVPRSPSMGDVDFCRRSTSRRGRGELAAVRLTKTLIAIVVMYVVLFIPAEFFNFFTDLAIEDGLRDGGAIYNTALAFGNLLQAVNFAVNFVLYCTVNTHFRLTIWRLLRCDQPSPQSTKIERNSSPESTAIVPDRIAVTSGSSCQITCMKRRTPRITSGETTAAVHVQLQQLRLRPPSNQSQ